MAVVQISRIQVRRGQKNTGSGLPQLASGEFGWAVDARELYIGNGAVSEGAPAVGNTKVLTQYDNIFDLADTYTYRSEDSWLDTGGTGTAITRSLQDRLDDRVSVRAFGATGDTTQIATSNLQTALDQLYLNDATKGSISSRVILYLEAGEYIVDDTIYIPPHATLVGEGSDKTVIRTLTSNKPVFRTVNSSSTPGSPASVASTTTLNQATNITIKGLTLESTVDNKIMILDCCKDSIFEDVKLKGAWESGDAIATPINNVGLEINSLSSSVESKNNTFNNCKFQSVAYGVNSDWDIHNNNWNDCEFYDSGYGLVFGGGLASLDLALGSGKQTGPVDNTWNNCFFHDINRQAIWIKYGTNNQGKANNFKFCGNDGSADTAPVYSVIKCETPGNSSLADLFSRTSVLSYNESYWDSVKYVPEIEGAITAQFGETHVLNTIAQTGIGPFGILHQKRFRLPAEDDIASQRYDIEYIIASRSYDSFRSGVLTININGISKTATVSDEQNYTGTTAYEDDISFDVLIQDANGDTVDDTIDVRIGSTMPSDDISQIEFKINLRKTIIDATGE